MCLSYMLRYETDLKSQHYVFLLLKKNCFYILKTSNCFLADCVLDLLLSVFEISSLGISSLVVQKSQLGNTSVLATSLKDSCADKTIYCQRYDLASQNSSSSIFFSFSGKITNGFLPRDRPVRDASVLFKHVIPWFFFFLVLLWNSPIFRFVIWILAFALSNLTLTPLWEFVNVIVCWAVTSASLTLNAGGFYFSTVQP